ncbi:MAG: CBS domain-containing protein [Thaumarchaeota archaeon]|nr:CBS domain-containing protein [Nitrososphaerota archaeon]
MKADQLMRMSAAELLTKVEIFPSNAPVSKAIGYLKESKLKETLVDDGDTNTCLVSIRDLLNVTSLNTRISTVMRKVPRLGKNNTVSDAATLMHEYRTRSMPIYQGKKLLGQITSPSIVGKLLDSELPGKISSIMSPNPTCLDASETVSKAREIMHKMKVDQLPVLKKGSLGGIVTSDQIVFNLVPETDRDAKGEARKGRFGESLATFAEDDPVTDDISDSLRDVYQNMSKRGSNYSVVMNMDEVQGIVTYRDFLSILSRRTTATSIPMYMVGLPDDPFEAETAREKFLRAVELLRRSNPGISEARAVIKMGETKAPKKKYEVNVFLASPTRRYSYRVYSFELADAFDYVNDWVKKLVGRSNPESGRRQKAKTSYYPDTEGAPQ